MKFAESILVEDQYKTGAVLHSIRWAQFIVPRLYAHIVLLAGAQTPVKSRIYP